MTAASWMITVLSCNNFFPYEEKVCLFLFSFLVVGGSCSLIDVVRGLESEKAKGMRGLDVVPSQC